MEKSVFFDHVRARYGFIKRCRGPYLYTSKEVRLVDLYQEGGRAILGWRTGKAMQVLKNSLERGMWGDYPGVGMHRLEKALSVLFSSCKGKSFTRFTWYYTIPKLQDTELSITPPLIFPWNGLSPEGIRDDVKAVYVIPPLPFPSLVIGASTEDVVLPASHSFSSSILEALTRSVYDLIDAFASRSDESWAMYDDIFSPYFVRKGSALYASLSQKEYDSFVLHCLDCGLVINPSPEYPSFIPYGVHRGVFRKLEKTKFTQGAKE